MKFAASQLFFNFFFNFHILYTVIQTDGEQATVRPPVFTKTLGGKTESTQLPTTTSNSLNTSLTQSLLLDFHRTYAELCQVFQCTGTNGQTNPGLYPTPLTPRGLHTICPLKHIWLQFLFLVMPDKS